MGTLKRIYHPLVAGALGMLGCGSPDLLAKACGFTHCTARDAMMIPPSRLKLSTFLKLVETVCMLFKTTEFLDAFERAATQSILLWWLQQVAEQAKDVSTGSAGEIDRIMSEHAID